mmetsp:Transcript_1557/g.4926  ORF Transcript_1557/g.4926 Transcript_1557/m.4926 type:complete len:85 (+) Transcript_1557:248-502(+)
MRVGVLRRAQQRVVRSRRMLSNRMVGCARGFSYDCARLRATLRPDGVFPLSLRESAVALSRRWCSVFSPSLEAKASRCHSSSSS